VDAHEQPFGRQDGTPAGTRTIAAETKRFRVCRYEERGEVSNRRGLVHNATDASYSVGGFLLGPVSGAAGEGGGAAPGHADAGDRARCRPRGPGELASRAVRLLQAPCSPPRSANTSTTATGRGSWAGPPGSERSTTASWIGPAMPPSSWGLPLSNFAALGRIGTAALAATLIFSHVRARAQSLRVDCPRATGTRRQPAGADRGAADRAHRRRAAVVAILSLVGSVQRVMAVGGAPHARAPQSDLRLGRE
jgi:hypothetical protein